MKKIALIAAFSLSAAVMLTACGGKQTENVQTESAAQSGPAGSSESAGTGAGPAADAVEETKPADGGMAPVVDLPEDYEQAFYEGLVTDYSGAVITVNDGSSSMSFDISRNDEDPDSPVVRGCYVEVSYADAPDNNIYPADGVAMINDAEQLAEAEHRDPVLYGTLQFMDVNELEIIDDAGRTISFDPVICRTVSFSELSQGAQVVVTYAGSIASDDADSEGMFSGDPAAIKIVSADAVSSEDGAANYLEGSVSSITDGGFILSNAIGDFEFEASDSVMSSVSEEDHAKVYYSGALTDLVIVAERVEAN
ncbi:MAG: hypothetical protein Q4E57_00500 [Eubacteriales bacterium]|nr:hypothetical protein [Eubacteriales bacterium]